MAEFIAGKIIGDIGAKLAGKATEEISKGISESLPIGDVIEWSDYEGREEEIVWRHPTKAIKWGTALIVKEYEAAAFFRDGKMYDVFGAGRHILTTPNLPLLSKISKKIMGDDAFTATVIFVSTKEFNGFFGGRTQTTELFPAIANGQYWFKVKDVTLFLNEVVGGNKKFTTEETVDFLRGFVNQNIMKELARYSLANIFTEGLDSTSLKTKTAIYEKFERFGLDLYDLRFSSLDTEERYRELAAMVKQGVSASEVLRMFTMRESAKELGKSQGGASLGAGFILPQMVSQMQPPTQPSEKKEDPLAVLKMMFVKGEISKEEYEERKKILES